MDVNRMFIAWRGLVLLSAALMALVLAPPPAFAQHPDLGGEKPVNDLCLGCHDDMTAKMGDKPHKAIESGCMTCHDVVAAKEKPFLRAEVNPLCLACHRPPVVPPGTLAPERVEIVQGYDVPGSALPLSAQVHLDARGKGHPIAGHPVGGVPDPLKKGKTLDCVSCHVPHGGPLPKLLAFVLKPGEGVCQHCHKM